MSIDFGALTHAVVAGVPDVRSCLMVSRDGLALGASPAAEEDRTLEVWTRIGALGDVERGFITVRDEIWVFCRRGSYGAVATASPTARPGLILDHLEQMVLMAEEARVRKEGVRQAPERDVVSLDPSRGLRTPLHRDRAAGFVPEHVISVEDTETAAPASPASPAAEASESQPSPETRSMVEEGAKKEGRQERSGDDSPVDRAELSREFAAILAEHEEEQE